MKPVVNEKRECRHYVFYKHVLSMWGGEAWGCSSRDAIRGLGFCTDCIDGELYAPLGNQSNGIHRCTHLDWCPYQERP